MNNFREVNEDDILRNWLDFRDDTIASLTSTEDIIESYIFPSK